MNNKYCEVATNLCPNSIHLINPSNEIFTAYSSHDEKLKLEINRSIIELNQNTNLKWKLWESDLDIENNMIFCEICQSLYKSKGVVIELSDLNFNVLFEYGYSIGIGKKIYPIVNENFDFGNIDRFVKPLIGIGIGQYKNNKLAQKILKKKFWEKELRTSVFDFSTEDILSDETKVKSNSILYIKNIDNSEINEVIENTLDKYECNVIIDDSLEEKNNIVWYSKQLKKSAIVIIDIGYANESENIGHYLKCAFIAGLAIATGRRTLIMNSVQRKKPSDIIQLIEQYSKPKEVKRIIEKYMDKNFYFLAIINSYLSSMRISQETIFDNMDLGEFVAENDALMIEKSFIETPEYESLFKDGYKLIIGRKGVGKSALFQKFLHEDIPNTIVVNKLFNQYNLNDIYDLTLTFENDNDKSKILSAFWSFVLYNLLAKEIAAFIELYLPENEINQNFLDFYSKFKQSNPDKSITESLVDIINNIRDSESKDVKSIQKSFYSNEIVLLLNQINMFFENYKIPILLSIDGLDNNLSFKSNPVIISKILYTLHEVSNLTLYKIKNPKFTINLFIREDLYDTFQDRIPQKDKVNKVLFNWSFENLLLMVNRRLQVNGVNNIADILSDDFNIHLLSQKIQKYVYLRPRDYIFLFSNIVLIAKSRNENEITSKIFNEAIEYYAHHIFESIQAELMSISVKLQLSYLMNGIKHINNENEKIPIDYLMTVFEAQELDEIEKNKILTFLLKIEFVYYIENNNVVKWSTLIDPSAKLQFILGDSLERKSFQFHPIIHHLLCKHF
ncbi:MAG: hypothetical protein KKF62_14535 [Bacteroidetes bacterium]|nr:hypothetical protein [Bacteroidota bacterium]MBU1116324.1 hypothetical protein [Bacteroidota bacterium]MBU1796988.1 hypothetical protein [Bacteroidota bacterium]